MFHYLKPFKLFMVDVLLQILCQIVHVHGPAAPKMLKLMYIHKMMQVLLQQMVITERDEVHIVARYAGA